MARELHLPGDRRQRQHRTGTITVNIVDDVPTAQADTNSVVEGAIVTGNVLTDGTADVFGADGATTTVPAGGVVGVAAGSDTSRR